jgi:Predicted membrane protein
MAWGLVYFSMPSPPPPMAADVPSFSPQAPLPLSGDTSVVIPPPVPAPPPADSSSSVSPQENPLSAPPPEPATAPLLPASKVPKLQPAKPPILATKPSAPPPPPSTPTEEIAALQNVSPSCIVELEKLCEGTEPGGARRKCFKDNESKLSPVCQRQMDDMAARIKEDMQHFRTACAGDVTQLCPDVHSGGGNVLQCLEENYKEVSENCYQALKRFQTRKAGRSL